MCQNLTIQIFKTKADALILKKNPLIPLPKWHLLNKTHRLLAFRTAEVYALKMFVFWVVAPCFRDLYCPTHHPEVGGSKDPWIFGKLIPIYTALQPRRQPSLYSSQWEPQVILSLCSVNLNDVEDCSSFLKLLQRKCYLIWAGNWHSVF
jgi:hypothetical protein